MYFFKTFFSFKFILCKAIIQKCNDELDIIIDGWLSNNIINSKKLSKLFGIKDSFLFDTWLTPSSVKIYIMKVFYLLQ